MQIGDYFCIPPILQTVVPHFGHFPFAIFVPFEVVDSFGSLISTFALHLTQYPCVAIFFSSFQLYFYKRFKNLEVLKIPMGIFTLNFGELCKIFSIPRILSHQLFHLSRDLCLQLPLNLFLN